MEEKLQFIGEWKSMENDLNIKFMQEKKEICINILQPDLAKLIHEIVAYNLHVTKENIDISAENKEFDKDEFLDILINVHEEFMLEIEQFYQNIQQDISTYYSDEELSKIIIQKLREDEKNLRCKEGE